MPPLENESQPSSDRDNRPHKSWFDVNQAHIRQKKHDSTGQKNPGSYAAMEGAILEPIGKTADCRSEQDGDRRRSVKRMPHQAEKAE